MVGVQYPPIRPPTNKNVLVTVGKIATGKNLHNYETKEGSRSIADNILPRWGPPGNENNLLCCWWNRVSEAVLYIVSYLFFSKPSRVSGKFFNRWNSLCFVKDRKKWFSISKNFFIFFYLKTTKSEINFYITFLLSCNSFPLTSTTIAFFLKELSERKI